MKIFRKVDENSSLSERLTLLFSLSKCCCNSVLFKFAVKKDKKRKCKRQMGGYLNEYLSGGSDEYILVSSLLSYHNN